MTFGTARLMGSSCSLKVDICTLTDRRIDWKLTIKERFDPAYPGYAEHFARLITYHTESTQSVLGAFSDTEKQLHIVISIGMLDAGIDIPEVDNLVFFRLVRSTSKFSQMLGRGTRLRPDLYGLGQDKNDFFIFDFYQTSSLSTPDRPLLEGRCPGR